MSRRERHTPTAGEVGRSLRAVWIVGIATIVAACIVAPVLVPTAFWACLGVGAWKIGRFVLAQTSSGQVEASDTCRRCDALLYRGPDKRWLAFLDNGDACSGRRHQPFGETARTGAR